MKNVVFLVLGMALIFNYGCNKVNILTVQDELRLGQQTKQQIASDPAQFPILPRQSNLEIYQLLESMRDEILNTGEIRYKNEFAWEVYVIDDPSTLNAFCTPGGYIYFYTGLLKYLDNSSAVAGVMGHEMAHADRRHSGKQITNQMGLELVLNIVAGTTGSQDIAQVANIAAGLTGLAFSRSAETEADFYSVNYLCPSTYQTDGAHDFFQKLIDNNQTGQTPAFLSTHPDPGKRVENITKQANELTGCRTIKKPYTNDATYIAIRNKLP